MKTVNVKVYTLTETEVQKLLRVAMELQGVEPPDNMKMFTQSALTKLKKDLES